MDDAGGPVHDIRVPAIMAIAGSNYPGILVPPAAGLLPFLVRRWDRLEKVGIL